MENRRMAALESEDDSMEKVRIIAGRIGGQYGGMGG